MPDNRLACAQAARNAQHHVIAQAELVAGVDGLCARQALLVDERAVGAAQIFDDIDAGLKRQPRVMAAHLRVFQDNVAACLAANGDDGLVEVKRLARSRALLHQKLQSTDCHLSLL